MSLPLHMQEKQLKLQFRIFHQLIPVAKRFKAMVYSRSLAGTAGSNPAGGTDICPL